MIYDNLTIKRYAFLIALIALCGAALWRYSMLPSFWLDEAFVALSLKEFSIQKSFAQLECGQYFPRLYLTLIGETREAFGYHIWILRFFPLLCFLTASFLWIKLLLKTARSYALAYLLTAALLIGSSFWLDQAIQLKQYTFDVLLALLPFFFDDLFFTAAFTEGKHKFRLLLLVLPCAFSYSYPFALCARVFGWYIFKAKKDGWRINPSITLMFLGCVVLFLLSIWLTDHQFNLRDCDDYYTYWRSCILRFSFQEGIGSVLRLIAKFLWGWHGRMPLATCVIVPLQIIGVYSTINKWRNNSIKEDFPGSLPLCSLLLLLSVILASIVINYPICTGRLTLFTQIHTQILTLEGAIFCLHHFAKKGMVFVAASTLIVSAYSAVTYVRFIRSEPAENLFPALSLMRPEISNQALVNICSVNQIRALPAPLPVQEVRFT